MLLLLLSLIVLRALGGLRAQQVQGTDREQWNKPDQIMDALKISEGSRVGEIGAGGGWFTLHLARRVRANGQVWAEDIEPASIQVIKRRAEAENLTNVHTVLGTTRESRLPKGLDAIVIVAAYHEMSDPVAILKNAAESLKPQGRLGIVEFARWRTRGRAARRSRDGRERREGCGPAGDFARSHSPLYVHSYRREALGQLTR